MYNVTLIGTKHSESGKCNSDELYKIIESIYPDIIFEELTSDLFEFIYNANSLSSLIDVVPEIKCVKKYIQNHNIKHIPVDKNIKYISDNEQNWMLYTFMKNFNYNKIETEQLLLAEQYGFDFLNSVKYLDLYEQKNVVIENIIGIDINKDELFRVHQLFKMQDDTRENSMLQNIYNYSKENQYNQAVFLIGAGHKKSIMQKITEFEKLSEINLNWTMYGNN